MHHLSSLLEKLPVVSHSRMVNRGFGVWMAWSSLLDESVVRSLRDFGGIMMVQDGNQAYWYFFSNDVFRVLARLEIWARLNPMPLFFQVMPATLLVDYNLSLSLNISDEFVNQKVADPSDFETFIHPQLSEHTKNIVGIELEDVRIPSGLSRSGWKRLEPDQSLNYDSMQKWYFIMVPVGNPSDKTFIKGWRSFFSSIQILMQRLGIHYITSDTKVILTIESLAQLRTFFRDLLVVINKSKSSDASQGEYWPTVMALVEQNGMSLNEDVVRKVALDWDKLAPDCPHLRFRDAYLLGSDFSVNEVRFGADQETVNGWCNVTLKGGVDTSNSEAMEVSISRQISIGELSECFYCGMKSHSPSECPSRYFSGLKKRIWKNLAAIDTENFSQGYQKVDEILQGKSDLTGEISKIIQGGNSYEGIVTKALFSLNAISQIKTLYMLWRSRGKEWPNGIYDQGPEEGELIWSAYESFAMGMTADSEVIVKNAMIRFSRSYQPRSLMGFIQLEAGDYDQAYFYWQESERLSYSPMQQGYFIYLQGRIQEVSGDLSAASDTYKRASLTCRDWLEPLYRRAVCMVKMGFSEQAVGYFEEIIEKDPNYFNRVSIDPELDRGRITVLQALGSLWDIAEQRAKEVTASLEALSADISQWFDEEHEFSSQATDYIAKMMEISEVKNYVAFQQLIAGYSKLTDEIEQRVDYEIKVINKKLEIFREDLLEIQREASWFPFPKLLTEFNADFNYCADKIYWIKNQHLKVAETFRKTQRYLTQIEQRVKKLRSRLVTLRVIRDSTLFIMLLGRTFIWLEVLFLGLALLCIPLLVYYSDNYQSNFIIDILIQQKWQFQKGMIIILSILALGLSAFRAAVVFEKKKRDLFFPEEE